MKREIVLSINVSATEGKPLQILARMMGMKRIFEIGTLGSYIEINFAGATLTA